MRALLFLGLALLATGCVSIDSMSRETKAEEIAWQTLHAIDSAQTYKNVTTMCMRETGSAQIFLGSQPNQFQVAAWAIGSAYAHGLITSWLSEHDSPKWLMRSWQAISIGVTLDTVAKNHAVGIRIGSPNVQKTVCGVPVDQPKQDTSTLRAVM